MTALNRGTPVTQVCGDGALTLLYVMATTQEYGPRLRQCIDPLVTGVGPVEAAAVTVHRLAELCAEGNRPDLLVSLGSAGSSSLDQGRIYQAGSVSYRDMDASPLGFEKGLTPFLDLPAKLTINQQLAGIPSASLSTGGNIVSGKAYDGITAQMVDMETFAVMRAGHCFDIPMIGLRGISDGRDPVSQYQDWARYLDHIDRELAEIIVRADDLFGHAGKAHWAALPHAIGK